MDVMIENKVVPKLRFGGSEDELYKYDFSEIAEKRSKSHNPNKDSTNYKCIELESLSQGTGALLNVFDSVNLKSNKTKFKKGDVLFGKLRPYLKKYLLTNFDGVCSSEIWVLNGIKVCNPYLFQLVQTPKFLFEANITSGSKMPRADWEFVKSIKYLIPSLPEQQKIASFLSAVDDKLQQLTKKKELLEEYKKGVMQKIFSQELRFKDDNGNNYPDWEEKKLGELCEFAKSGGTPKSTNKDYYNGNIPFLSISDMTKQGKYLNYAKKSISEEGVSNSSSWIVPVNTIIYSMYASVGFVAINKIPIATSQAVINLGLNSDCNTEFIYYNLVEIKKIIHRFIETGTQGNLNAQTVKNLKIELPCLKEQDKIANFLSSLDSKIELVSTQIDNTKAFKKGLLQQMFV